MTESLRMWTLNHRRSLKYLLVGAVLAGVMSAVSACGGSSQGQDGAAAAAAGAMAVPVDMVTLAPRPVEQVGEFVATIKSRRSTNIQPQAEGFLTRILVKSGDRVTPGTPLFEIDAAPQQAAVASLESVRAAREADAVYARQQAERAKALLAVGAMSQQEADQAASQLQAAEAQRRAVDEQIKQQKVELAYYHVTAPTAGVVGDIPVRQGDRVTKTTMLTTVDDNQGLEVYINVPVQQASKLRVGLPVRIADDTGADAVTEHINFISPSVDDQTQTVLVKTPLASSRRFRTDQFVRAHVVFSNDPALTVPVVAVTRVNGQYFVFVAEAGPKGGLVARQRALTVGPVNGNEYVVLSGVKAGDKLITSGIQKIGDGAPVQAMPPSAPAAAPAGGGR